MSTRQKPTSGLRPCDRNCSKFFPALFWSHNQKGEKGLALTSLFTNQLNAKTYVLTLILAYQHAALRLKPSYAI